MSKRRRYNTNKRSTRGCNDDASSVAEIQHIIEAVSELDVYEYSLPGDQLKRLRYCYASDSLAAKRKQQLARQSSNDSFIHYQPPGSLPSPVATTAFTTTMTTTTAAAAAERDSSMNKRSRVRALQAAGSGGKSKKSAAVMEQSNQIFTANQMAGGNSMEALPDH